VSIELKSISKKFGEVTAVNDVNFSVNDGELVGLLGPSGGGKTTVLRMIAGLEVPTEGDIFIRGQRVNDVSVQQRNIGFVFQGYALFRNMSVFKNIAFGLKIKKWKRADIEARVAELIGLFGLSGLEALPASAFRRATAAGRHRPLPCAEAERLVARRTVRRRGRKDPSGTT
jgi:sulfate transport system ATP-binding protein